MRRRPFDTRPARRHDAFEEGWSQRTVVGAGGMLAALAALVGCGLAVMFGAFGGGQGGDEAPEGAWRPEESVATPGAAGSADRDSADVGTVERTGQEPIKVPAARGVGEVGVPTGFPPTPAGALGQLVALDRVAFESASLPTAQAVVRGWSAPGGPDPIRGSLATAVSGLLSAVPANQGEPAAAIDIEPTLGLFREPPRPGHVEPCVVFVLSVSVSAPNGDGALVPQQVAISDCQRLVWRVDRWVLAPGDEPPASPSVWPGTPAAVDAGYALLEFE